MNAYSNRDLRGESFRDQDLTGSDFTAADVRGADFSRARLVEADFTGARLGVRPMTGLLILTGALLVSIAAGLAIGDLAQLTRDRATSSDWRDVFAGSLLMIVVLTFLAALVLRGLREGLGVFLVAFAMALTLDFTVVFIVAGEVRLRDSFAVIALLLLFAPAVMAGILGRIVGGTFGAWAIAGVAVLGALAAGRVEGGAAGIAVSALLVLVSRRALALDERDRLLLGLAHSIVTRRGTKFTGADLTGADFTGTLIAHSDVANATVDGTKWESGKGPGAFGATH